MTSPSTKLARLVRQVPPAARAHEHRDPELLGDRLGPAAWSASTWVNATATIRPPRACASADRPVERLAGRVARIDQHERRPTNEVRVDRLASDAATGRHLDPDDAVAPRPRRRPRPSRPGASRAAMSSIERACASCMSVVEVGNHIPRPPAAIDSSASIGRCQACADTSSPTRVTAAPGGNAAAKNRASNRRGIDAGVTQRDSGTSRSVRSRRSSDSAMAGNAPASASSRDRAATRSTPGRVIGQQHADLLERLPDRRDVRGERRPRLQVATQALGRRGRRQHGPRGQTRIGVGRVDPPAREHVHVGRERHRRRPMGQQDLEPVGARPHQDDGRRRPRDDGIRVGHESILADGQPDDTSKPMHVSGINFCTPRCVMQPTCIANHTRFPWWQMCIRGADDGRRRAARRPAARHPPTATDSRRRPPPPCRTKVRCPTRQIPCIGDRRTVTHPARPVPRVRPVMTRHSRRSGLLTCRAPPRRPGPRRPFAASPSAEATEPTATPRPKDLDRSSSRTRPSRARPRPAPIERLGGKVKHELQLIDGLGADHPARPAQEAARRPGRRGGRARPHAGRLLRPHRRLRVRERLGRRAHRGPRGPPRRQHRPGRQARGHRHGHRLHPRRPRRQPVRRRPRVPQQLQGRLRLLQQRQRPDGRQRPRHARRRHHRRREQRVPRRPASRPGVDLYALKILERSRARASTPG